jgi:hypothetical protein
VNPNWFEAKARKRAFQRNSCLGDFQERKITNRPPPGPLDRQEDWMIDGRGLRRFLDLHETSQTLDAKIITLFMH